MVVQFDNDKVVFNGDDKVAFCPLPSCPNCTTQPRTNLSVTIAGVGDDFCAGCEIINDTFILTYDGVSESVCWWSLFVEGSICGTDPFSIEVSLTSFSALQVLITIYHGIDAYSARYEINNTDCANWDELEISFVSKDNTLCTYPASLLLSAI